MFFKSMILPRLSNMYVPTKRAISAESKDPIVTSNFSVPVFTHVLSLFISTDFLHANIYNSSLARNYTDITKLIL